MPGKTSPTPPPPRSPSPPRPPLPTAARACCDVPSSPSSSDGIPVRGTKAVSRTSSIRLQCRRRISTPSVEYRDILQASIWGTHQEKTPFFEMQKRRAVSFKVRHLSAPQGRCSKCGGPNDRHSQTLQHDWPSKHQEHIVVGSVRLKFKPHCWRNVLSGMLAVTFSDGLAREATRLLLLGLSAHASKHIIRTHYLQQWNGSPVPDRLQQPFLRKPFAEFHNHL